MGNTVNTKIGAVILCRYNSTRLPGKVLIKIAGKEALGYVYERLLKVMPSENIVVETSEANDCKRRSAY